MGPDLVVRVGVVLAALGLVGLGRPGRQGLGEVVELLPEAGVRTGAEVDVEEVRDVRIVGTPAEEEQRELALRLVAQIGVVLLDDQADLDPDVGQLRLEVRRDLGRAREIAADLRPVVEVVGLAEVEAGVGEHLLRLRRIGRVPLVAAAGEWDGTRGEVVRRLRSGRIEVVGDALPVEAHRDRLADLLVVPRGLVHVEAEIQDVQRFARQDLQVRVVLNRLEVIRRDVVDAVDGSGLEILEALRGFLRPFDHDRLGFRLVAPVVRVGFERDLGAGDPFLELVRRGAVDRIVGDALVLGVGVQPVTVLDIVRGEGDLRQEGHVGAAEVELDRQLIDGGDLLEDAGVRRGVRSGRVLGRVGAVDCGLRIGLGGERRGTRRARGRLARPRRGRAARARTRAHRAGTGAEDDREHAERGEPRPSRGTGHALSPPQTAPCPAIVAFDPDRSVRSARNRPTGRRSRVPRSLARKGPRVAVPDLIYGRPRADVQLAVAAGRAPRAAILGPCRR